MTRFQQLQGGRLLSLSGQPVPVFYHTDSRNVVRLFFLMFKWNFQYFSLCSLPTVLQVGTTKKLLLLPSFHIRPYDIYKHR